MLRKGETVSHRRRFPMLLALLAVAGCWEDIQQASTSNGTYTLLTVNGASLPYSSTAGGTTTVILDDQFSLYEGFTWAETSHRRVTANGTTTDVTFVATGTFAIQSHAIFFTTSDGSRQFVANGDGTRMTIVINQVASVYSK
jgi:hypothetical protein